MTGPGTIPKRYSANVNSRVEIARRNDCLCFCMENLNRPSLHCTVGTCWSHNTSDEVIPTRRSRKSCSRSRIFYADSTIYSNNTLNNRTVQLSTSLLSYHRIYVFHAFIERLNELHKYINNRSAKVRNGLFSRNDPHQRPRQVRKDLLTLLDKLVKKNLKQSRVIS